jgi:hypothetical protein
VVSNVITMKVSNERGYSEVEKSLVRLRAEQVGYPRGNVRLRGLAPFRHGQGRSKRAC